MTRFRRILAPALVVLALGTTGALAQQQEKTLYQRLGGYDTIAAIVDEVGSRFGGDDQLKRFFRGHSQNSLGRQRQLAVDLVCEMSGGPCIYIGRDLKTTHGGLGISPSDWTRSMNLLTEVLTKFDLAERERSDFLALIATLETYIVEK